MSDLNLSFTVDELAEALCKKLLNERTLWNSLRDDLVYRLHAPLVEEFKVESNAIRQEALRVLESDLKVAAQKQKLSGEKLLADIIQSRTYSYYNLIQDTVTSDAVKRALVISINQACGKELATIAKKSLSQIATILKEIED